MNLQELSLEVYGYEMYECPVCGRVYSEHESEEHVHEEFAKEVMLEGYRTMGVCQ